jgi:hypothetical protein
VQRALARLSIDQALRDQFFADPARGGAALGLRAEEALGLARIPRRQVEQFADSLARKRRDQVRRLIPKAAHALGRQYAVLFERYIGESRVRGSKAGLDDAAAFVAALAPQADSLEPSWAVELARYELSCRQAALAGRCPILRVFRFPVGRLGAGLETEPVTPRATLACWWRPRRRAATWHVVISMPRLGLRRSAEKPVRLAADLEMHRPPETARTVP